MSGEAYTHILVIGHPRGGTSILFNMLCAAWPQFDHQAAETRAAVRELGYEPDDGWIEEIG